MKRILFTVIFMIALLAESYAQNVITNNYASTPSVSQQKTEDEDYSAVSLQYIAFDGMANYGIEASTIKPNGFSKELRFRFSTEKHGNLNFELGLNYSVEIANNNGFSSFLVMALGPSVGSRDQFKGYDQKDKPKYERSTFIDAYINPRFVIRYKAFAASIGYFYWAPKFKFSKDEGGIGALSLTLGFDI